MRLSQSLRCGLLSFVVSQFVFDAQATPIRGASSYHTNEQSGRSLETNTSSSCTDNIDFTFDVWHKTLDGDKELPVQCGWLQENSDKVQTRIDKWCTENSVFENCPMSCERCVIATNTKTHSKKYDWVQIGSKLGNKDEIFCGAVDISDDGKTVIIGCPTNNGNKGSVYVYRWSEPSKNWELATTLNGETALESAGSSVSFVDSDSGTQFLAVGYPLLKTSKVRVFKLVEISQKVVLEQVGKDILGIEDFEGFGVDIDLSKNGNRIAVGTDASVSLRVYDFNDKQGWVEKRNISPLNGSQSNFGDSVALSKDGVKLVFGSRKDSNNMSVESFNVDANATTWSLPTKSPSVSKPSVSISDDGSHIAVGEGKFLCSDGYSCGRVRVFKNGENATQIGTDIVLDDGETENCGRSVELSNDGKSIVVRCLNIVYVASLNAQKWEIESTFPSGEMGRGDSVAMTSSGTTFTMINSKTVETFERVPIEPTISPSPSISPSRVPTRSPIKATSIPTVTRIQKKKTPKKKKPKKECKIHKIKNHTGKKKMKHLKKCKLDCKQPDKTKVEEVVFYVYGDGYDDGDVVLNDLKYSLCVLQGLKNPTTNPIQVRSVHTLKLVQENQYCYENCLYEASGKVYYNQNKGMKSLSNRPILDAALAFMNENAPDYRFAAEVGLAIANVSGVQGQTIDEGPANDMAVRTAVPVSLCAAFVAVAFFIYRRRVKNGRDSHDELSQFDDVTEKPLSSKQIRLNKKNVGEIGFPVKIDSMDDGIENVESVEVSRRFFF